MSDSLGSRLPDPDAEEAANKSVYELQLTMNQSVCEFGVVGAGDSLQTLCVRRYLRVGVT